MFKNSGLDKNKQKLVELENKKKKLEAEARKLKSAISKKERTEDTRRKILLGSLLMAKIENGQWSQENLLGELEALFDAALGLELGHFRLLVVRTSKSGTTVQKTATAALTGRAIRISNDLESGRAYNRRRAKGKATRE